MTTEDHTQLDRIEAKLDRVLELIEQRNVPKLARGGYVKSPGDDQPLITSGTGCVTKIDPPGPGKQAIVDATIAELKHQGRLRP